MQGPLNMKHAVLLTMLWLPACAGQGASFADIQRKPPAVSETTASYLVKNARPLAEWIAETTKKCARFGCVD